MLKYERVASFKNSQENKNHPVVFNIKNSNSSLAHVKDFVWLYILPILIFTGILTNVLNCRKTTRTLALRAHNGGRAIIILVNYTTRTINRRVIIESRKSFLVILILSSKILVNLSSRLLVE